MNSYDDIKSILEAELKKAMTLHECELLNRHSTGEAMARAIERYNSFAFRGMIPEGLTEDDAIFRPAN